MQPTEKFPVLQDAASKRGFVRPARMIRQGRCLLWELRRGTPLMVRPSARTLTAVSCRVLLRAAGSALPICCTVPCQDIACATGQELLNIILRMGKRMRKQSILHR